MVHSSAGSSRRTPVSTLCDLLLLRLAVFQHEVHLQQLGDEVEGQRLAVRVAAAGQERDGVLGQPALELVGQARLADAGGAHHREHVAAPALRLVEGVPQEGQRALSPHEGREPALERQVEARPPAQAPGGGEGRHRRAAAP